MKGKRPSRTAHMVAMGRALADAGISHVAKFSDPTARVFVSEKGKQALAKIDRAIRGGKRNIRLEAARTSADIMALRTTAIDAAVRAAITDGAKQLVILGAGYDGRAWRLQELTGVRIYEVDHPATQGEKRAHLSELPRPNGDVTFVPIDFERESLGAVLERAGHDRAVPTCWIWEGVVMYLTHDAMRATLRDIAGRSAPDSTLIVNYHTVRRGLLARLIFWLLGEPQISAWTPEEMAEELGSVGFVVREDSGILDWNERFAQGKARVSRVAYMHIAVARHSRR